MVQKSNSVWVLPPDVKLIPIEQVDRTTRSRLSSNEGDWVVFREHSRSGVKLIDSEGAKILQEFRHPRTLVEATIRYSLAMGSNPEEVLESSFSLLEELAKSGLLVPQNALQNQVIEATLKPGNNFLGYHIESCIHVLEDTEVYRVRNKKGEYFALKLERPETKSKTAQRFEREAAILRYLDGKQTPRIKIQGINDGRSYLIMEWCEGRNASLVAHQLRTTSQNQWNIELLDLCCDILEAYTVLHDNQVLHGDIHPRNLHQ